MAIDWHSRRSAGGQRLSIVYPFVALFVIFFVFGQVQFRRVDQLIFDDIPAPSRLDDATAAFAPHLPIKTEGEGWQIWDQVSVLNTDDSSTPRVCEWATFWYTPWNNPTEKESIPMCVHPSPDVLSDTIRKTGTWDECGRLVAMWNYEATQRSRTVADTSRKLNKVFLDIGANIGSCVFQMLLETDAEVMAFEPNPRNLFRLTSTLRLLPREIRERAYVFPIGIGEETGSAAIANDLRTNAGATMLSPRKSGGGVAVEPLDSILLSIKDTIIPVAKIDVQGFECKVLRGMKRFLEDSHIISSLFTEVEKRYLKTAGCDPEEMFKSLQRGGFSIFEDDGQSPISALPKLESPIPKQFYNIVGRREKHEP